MSTHEKDEIWKPVPYEGCEYYEASTMGNIRNTRTQNILKGFKINTGYFMVGFKRKKRLIHRIIAETFIPNPENKRTVDHINRDIQDNRACNLRWATQGEQVRNQVRDRFRMNGIVREMQQIDPETN